MSGAIPVWLPAAARVAAGALAALGATWRVEYADGFQTLDRELRAGRRCIFAVWHSRMLPLVITHGGRGIAVLVSRHRDGEWISRVIEAFGYRSARGSSTRGGGTAMLELMTLAERGHLLGITPDGPRGPAERLKPGLVYLASRIGWPVVPIAVASDHAWVLNSWDRFRVPRPFARVRVAYGAPIAVPPDVPLADEPAWRDRLEQALRELTAATAAAVQEPA